MSALTQDRNTPTRESVLRVLPVAAETRIFAGSLVALDDGVVIPGGVDTGLIALGRAEEHVDNRDGGAGDLTVRVRAGTFRWNNSAAADAIAIADIGSTCYIVDDQTVAKTDGSSARSPAGTVFDVDADGVWVTSP